MAKQEADCITPDPFTNVSKVGRPRTNPLTREQQSRINKRNQLKCDKAVGLRRIELKLYTGMIRQLENLAASLNIGRAELIETILQNYLDIQKTGN